MENKPKNSLLKWGALGIGVLLGVSHFSMIGLLSNRKTLPEINLPVGPYTSYEVEAGHEGYRISYRANDPKVMTVKKDINKKGGFLGLGNNKTKVIEEYTVVGTQHIGGGNNEKLISEKGFTKKIKVTPKQGRVVLFDGALYHTAEQPNHNLRCIVNYDLRDLSAVTEGVRI